MTSIEWTHAPGFKGESWNPVVGCSLESPGCTNCYAMRKAFRLAEISYGKSAGAHGLEHYRGLTKKVKGAIVWTDKIAAAPEPLFLKPLKWKKPRMVFVNSMGDLFHDYIPDETIDRVFAIMALCPQHRFLVLTKRHERMREYCSAMGNGEWASRVAAALAALPAHPRASGDPFPIPDCPFPLLNVWLGVSAEDQRRADERIPALLDTPAAVRFVSCEPLLSALDLSPWLHDGRRESILGADRSRSIQGREREDLAPSEMDRRRPSIGACLYSENEGGAQHGRAGQLSAGDVQGRREAPEDQRAPNYMDGRQSKTDPNGYGDQSYRRTQAQQSSGKSGTGDASAERSTLAHASSPEKEGPAWREELRGGVDGSAGHGDTRDLEKTRAIAAGNRHEIPDYSIDCVGDSPAKELGSPSLNWIIAGGESGPGARPPHPDWFRSLRDQCQSADVPFFFKQWGSYAPHNPTTDEAAPRESLKWVRLNPDDENRTAIMRNVGKTNAGATLDGREHRAFPLPEKVEAA